MAGGPREPGGGAYSELMRNIRAGKFVYTGEAEPHKTTDISEIVEAFKALKGWVVAVNVTDNPTAYAYMSSLAASYIIQRETGIEAIYQVTCRDRNRLAITADLLGAYALGIRNVLALTGDHPSVGDNPQAKPVFDLDSATLVYLIRKMVDEGVDLAGNPIEHPPKFHVGIAANPNAEPLEPELLKIERKVKLGVDFIQTQSVYDIDIVKGFLKEAEKWKVPILIGITPFKSVGMMKFMIQYVPGIKVPKEIQERIIEAKKRGGKEAVYEENIDIFTEMIKELKKTTRLAGCHMMAVGFEWIVPKIIERVEGGKPEYLRAEG